MTPACGHKGGSRGFIGSVETVEAQVDEFLMGPPQFLGIFCRLRDEAMLENTMLLAPSTGLFDVQALHVDVVVAMATGALDVLNKAHVCLCLGGYEVKVEVVVGGEWLIGLINQL